MDKTITEDFSGKSNSGMYHRTNNCLLTTGSRFFACSDLTLHGAACKPLYELFLYKEKENDNRNDGKKGCGH